MLQLTEVFAHVGITIVLCLCRWGNPEVLKAARAKADAGLAAALPELG